MLAILLLGAALAVTPPATAGRSPPPIVAMPAPLPVADEAALPTPQFRRFGLADGLPSSAINAVEQDSQGFLWFGGSGGLARYDGTTFKTYVHEPGQADSLASTDITQLAATGDGSLWIGTGDAGLDRFDAASGRFAHWRHDPHDPDSLSSDVVYALALAADGSLWVGTSEGLDHLSPDGRQVRHVPYLDLIDGEPVAKDKVVGALRAEPDGTLWIGTWSGVLLKRAPDGRMRWIAVASGEPGPDQIWRIEGRGDDLRIGTRHGLLGIGPDGVARPLFDAARLPAGYVFASARDRGGRLWMATIHGVAMADRYGGIHRFHSQPLLLGGLPGEWVWRVFRDREGGMWFTFNDGGVAYLAPDWERFSRYTHIPDDAGSLRGTAASVVAASADGQLWVGDGDRIDKLDPATGKAVHVIDGLKSPLVSMVDDGHGLWFTVRGTLMRYAGGRTDRIGQGGDVVRRPELLEKGADGAIYVTVARYGLVRIDPKTLAAVPVPMPPDAADVDLRPGLIDMHDGVLWYANHEGLMRWDAALGRMAFVPGVSRGSDVEAGAFGTEGFWLARSDTLEHYRWQGAVAVRDKVVGADQGWTAPVLLGLSLDGRERLWLFTQTSLQRFDPATGRFYRFGAQDGLLDGEFNGSAVLLATGGRRLYAPTQGGVIGFDPLQDDPHYVAPPVALADLSVRDGHGTRRIVPATRELELGWRVRELRVSARALTYINPAAVRYRFRLDGLDPGWVDAGHRGERELMDLPAGSYTLEVEAADVEGPWGRLAVPLRIHVQAPPWARWWAWLAYLAAAVLLVWLALRSWQRRIGHRHAIQMAEQRGHLAEQASAAKTQFLATLSHEIRTPMTGVMGMAELLLSTRLDETQLEYTRAMQRSGSMLLKLLNDTLDLARIEAGRLELEPAPFNPRQLIDDVAQLEQGLAQVRGLNFVVEVAADLPAWLIGDAVRIKQVMLNLANNALKFTERGGVTLSASWTADGIQFSVSDTGPGIPEASQARLFQRFEQDAGPQRHSGSGLGLAICRELVSMMGGSIELESRMGHGSTFRVRLPLREATDPRLPIPAPLAHPGESPVSREGHCRVLLVEDDAIVAAVIRGLLERQGHQVCYVGNGLAAMAELGHAAFDVVLLDLDLPGVDGFQIARLIRQREAGGSRTPLIAITARAGSDEEARTREAGMDGFLRKPLTGEQLDAKISAVLRELAMAG